MRIRTSLRIRQGSCSSRSKLPRIHPVLLAAAATTHTSLHKVAGSCSLISPGCFCTCLV